ncbi:hypothetical protein CYMTET_42087 [Cymbomonas tetramitiformis]|uniref:Reverse transcriptase domain-containing protein n=1 Tax=Cymbomonas tetramitiformis TaxID=36881 RepID=A0AAE0C645_9CHLO|nr:hypothetical protein CYMTET_42087 [Cymbomonas tetramitiformis]
MPAPVTASKLWPPLLRKLWQDTTTVSLAAAGTSVTQWQEFISELRDAGASVPNMTANACRMAAAFKTDPDKVFLVRGAACGVGFPFKSVPEDTFYTVENYVPAEHWEAMDKEIRKERAAGNVVMVKMEWSIQGISAVGVVAKERKGGIKFRPVWDYSRPEDVGVNSRIDLEKEKFSSIKDAYALLRPGLWMAKLDLTAAYRSVPVAAMYWIAHVFEWDEEVLADTRAPFGNSAMPGIFMRFTRGIVRWMKAQGASIVGYLDDFLLIGSKKVVSEFLLLLREFVTFLGFEVNDDKCEGPFQAMEFLGILLSTEGNQCTASISEDRILVVQQKIADIRRLGALAGSQVPRTLMEGLLGLLAFCGQVVYGLSLYTRYAHALLAQARGRYLRLTDKVVQDLKVIVTVIRLYNGRKVRLDRVEIKWEWFSSDASTGKGMGAVLDRRWFAVTWAWLICQPQEPYFPFRPDCPESYDIGYLELFTVFWAIVLWGKYITGKTVVIRIDNNCVIGQVEKWWGPAAYIPLLRQLFYVCVQHDVRLRPVYISSEDNIYADLLSRDRVEDFRARFEADKQRLVWIEDRDDWMLIPTLWHPLDVQLGPFTVDCCVSENGANSFCRVGWTKEDDARIMDFSGHNAWGNLPFSDFIDIVRNFLRCKRRAQRGTSATFLVPWWPGNPGFELVVSLPGVFRIVRRWERNSALFTAPSPEGGGRTFWGTTDWPVIVVHCPPCEVSWTDTELTGVTGARGFLDKMLPAEDAVLADWVAYMVTERAVKPDTAKKYTSGVRALHVQLGFEWVPVRQRWAVHAVLQGCGRRWDTPSKQVMPMGFEELLLIAGVLNPHNFNENVVFAAMDTCFFCFFRKDNVSVEKAEAWNPRGHLVRSDVTFPDGASADIRVRHSKTIQAGERYHHVQMRHVPGSPLCPVTSLQRVMEGPGLGEDGPLFCIEDAKGRLKPLTHSFFVSTFRKLAERAGLDPKAYSGHSFRRGGATAASGLAVPGHLIQAHGDWASDCYKLYIDLGREQQLLLPSAMAEGAAAATAAHRAGR